MEMREMLKRVWPKITKKTLDRVIPKRPKGLSFNKKVIVMSGKKILCSHFFSYKGHLKFNFDSIQLHFNKLFSINIYKRSYTFFIRKWFITKQ